MTLSFVTGIEAGLLEDTVRMELRRAWQQLAALDIVRY